MKTATVIEKGFNELQERGFDVIFEYIDAACYGKVEGRCADGATVYKPAEEMLYVGGDPDHYLVVESYETVECINRWLNKNYGEELKEETRYGLPSKDVKYFTKWLDYLTNDQWSYLEETFECGGCYKLYPMMQGSIEYTPKVILPGWDACYCEECVNKNVDGTRDEYLQTLINNPENCNTVLTRDTLCDLGFEKVNAYPYENGFYNGQDANPKTIMAKYRNPNTELVFSYISDGNPFQVCFNLWQREKEDAT